MATAPELLRALMLTVHQQLREQPDVGQLHPCDVEPTSAIQSAIQQAAEAIEDILTCTANLSERVLSEDEQRPFLDHIRNVHAMRFGFDLTNERDARAALVELLEASATEAATKGAPENAEQIADPRPHIDTLLDSVTTWIPESYRDHFPSYAAALSTPAKRLGLRKTAAAWIIVAMGKKPPKSKWEMLAVLGRGVFGKSQPHPDSDWKRLAAKAKKST